MSENEVSGVYGTQASAMSLKEKFMMIIETAAMNEEQIGEYCRKHGIYKSDLDSWKNECSQALEEGYIRTSIQSMLSSPTIL